MIKAAEWYNTICLWKQQYYYGISKTDGIMIVLLSYFLKKEQQEDETGTISQSA
jgi:hypothetical protein